MADTQTIHPHLSGVLAPVRSEDDFEMKVVGRIPDALAGAYYRNGPNPRFDPQGMYYGFLGDGMIHGFFLEPNRDGSRGRFPAPYASMIHDFMVTRNYVMSPNKMGAACQAGLEPARPALALPARCNRQALGPALPPPAMVSYFRMDTKRTAPL